MAVSEGAVYRVDPLQDSRWVDFVTQHANASAFHTRGWLRALRDSYGYEPVGFTTSSPGEPLTNAILFCVVRSWLTGGRLVSLPFSDQCEPLVEDAKQFKTIYGHLKSLKQGERWKYIEVRSSSTLQEIVPDFREAASFVVHRLDLRPDLDALRDSFHRDCVRRKISRAEREGLQVETGRHPSLLSQFYRLLQITRLRHRVPPQPFGWFQNIMTHMGNDVCIRVALKSGRPIAGILTLKQGKVEYYKYGASDARYHNLGAVQLLLWRAIQDAKQAGGEVFDFGRTDADNITLRRFKERWSPSCVPLTRWVAPRRSSDEAFESLKIRSAKALCATMPDRLLIVAGRLLYRHIG